MKKILAIILSLCAICSMVACGATTSETTEPPASAEESAVSNESENSADMADIVDQVIREIFGDDVYDSDYSDDTETYMVIITIDGINRDDNTTKFASACDSINSLSETIFDTFSLNNVIILAKDNDPGSCLYASLNGDDATHIFK